MIPHSEWLNKLYCEIKDQKGTSHEETIAIIENLAEKSLTERRLFILRHRIPLHNYPQKTLKEIGQTLGITRERVRQLEKGIYYKINQTRKEKEQEHSPINNSLC